jgi:hypothetical protein
MKIKRQLKSGRVAMNENETAAAGVRIKSRLKSGRISRNENETAAGVPIVPEVKPGASITHSGQRVSRGKGDRPRA